MIRHYYKFHVLAHYGCVHTTLLLSLDWWLAIHRLLYEATADVLTTSQTTWPTVWADPNQRLITVQTHPASASGWWASMFHTLTNNVSPSCSITQSFSHQFHSLTPSLTFHSLLTDKLFHSLVNDNFTHSFSLPSLTQMPLTTQWYSDVTITHFHSYPSLNCLTVTHPSLTHWLTANSPTLRHPTGSTHWLTVQH